MPGFDAWGAAQWVAVLSAVAAIATALATRSAAKAAKAAERSIEAYVRPHIVAMFVRRGDTIVLRLINAGGPARHITLDTDPPLANARGQCLTDRPDLRDGYPVLLPMEAVEFPFDDLWRYFGVPHLRSGRPLDFAVEILGWAAGFDRQFINRQRLSLRTLEPPTPRILDGLETALADLQRWARRGPDATEQAEQAERVKQIVQYATVTGFGPLDVGDVISLERLLEHLGWRVDARYRHDCLVMAERHRGVRTGERIGAAGWDVVTALSRLIAVALAGTGQKLFPSARRGDLAEGGLEEGDATSPAEVDDVVDVAWDKTPDERPSA